MLIKQCYNEQVKTKALLLLLVLAGIAGLLLFRSKSADPTVPSSPKETTDAMPVSFEASFEIYTNNTKRIFTDSKYHNQSEEVYLEATDPSTVHIRAKGITWGDFFATLPMKLTKDCLTTGTGQNFCESGGGKLGFFINDKEEPDALDKGIAPDDHLLITYK